MTRRSVHLAWQWVTERALARIGKNALALLAAQAGAKLLNLALAAQLARALGVAALGRYLLALTVETIALAVADLGINVYTVREMARDFARTTPHASAQRTARKSDAQTLDAQALSETGRERAKGDRGGPESERQELWGTVLALKLVAALCSTLILNVSSPLLFPGDGRGERQMLIAIASLALLPEAWNGIATAAIKSRQRMEISSAINVAVRLAATGGGILLLRAGQDERALLCAYVAASLLGSCAFAGVLWAWGVRARLGGLRRRWRTVLREAAPFAITGVVAMLYSRMDLLMLSHWQGDLAAGLYGAAYRVSEALGMIPASLLDALFPELSRLGANGANRAYLRALYRRGQTLVWLLTGLVAVPSLILAPRFMALLYGRGADTDVTSALFRALLLAFPFTYLYLLNGHLLYAVGEQLRVTRAMIAATVANGLLNALAIPRWSYLGAAGTAIFSQILLYVLLQGMAGRTVLRAAETPAPAQGGKRL